MEIDYAVAPKAGSVYLHPQILVLGLKFPLMSFVHDLLRHFKIAPSQLVAEVWRVILARSPLLSVRP